MTNPVCRDCGRAEDLEWGKTKAGKPILMQRRLVPHFALCPAHIAAVRKNGAPARRQSRKSGDSPAPYAAKLLRDMNYTKAEAADMLRDVPEGEPEAMVLAALTRMGADAAS
jgi:hypothetical protein